MRKSNSPKVKTDPQFHVRKTVAGGATGAVLGAVVAGPVGALVGGLVGTAVGSAAERGKLIKNVYANAVQAKARAPKRPANRHGKTKTRSSASASSASSKRPRDRHAPNSRRGRTRTLR